MASIAHYEHLGIWSCFLAVIMPDHLHALLAFGRTKGMTASVRDWKRYHATHHGVCWQNGFFDHRIRSHTEFTQSFHYIRQNPVASGLCGSEEEWPWTCTAMSPDSVPHF